MKWHNWKNMDQYGTRRMCDDCGQEEPAASMGCPGQGFFQYMQQQQAAVVAAVSLPAKPHNWDPDPAWVHDPKCLDCGYRSSKVQNRLVCNAPPPTVATSISIVRGHEFPAHYTPAAALGGKGSTTYDPCTKCGVRIFPPTGRCPGPNTLNGHNFGTGRHCVDCGTSTSGAIMGSSCPGPPNPLLPGSGPLPPGGGMAPVVYQRPWTPPPEPKCECGAASTGAKAYSFEHSPWCAVSVGKETK